MSQLNRKVSPTHHRSGGVRPIPENAVETAKKQAYMLRDLIHEHASQALKGGDITDLFAMTYHGADWSTLMATQREPDGQPYYGASSRDVVAQQAQFIRDIAGIPVPAAVRSLLCMPKPQYTMARTTAGALLATTLSAKITWQLPDFSGAPSSSFKLPDGVRVEAGKADAFRVFDARTDRGYLVKHFCSDPETNAELVRAYDWRTGEEIDIPVEEIRYTQFARPAGSPKTDYVLTEHTPSDIVAKSFYKVGGMAYLNFPLARHWYNSGNDLHVTAFCAGTAIRSSRLSEWETEESRDFDTAIQALRDFHGSANVVMRPDSLREVNRPEDRWNPTFRNVRAILPEVREADARYQTELDSIGVTTSGEEANQKLRDATRQYNEVLLRALDAFWQGTREINSLTSLRQAYGFGDAGMASEEVSERLAFSVMNPMERIYELTGLR